MSRMRSILLSHEFQVTLQLVAAVCITTIASLAGQGYIRYSCLLPVFTVMALSSLSANNHLGTRLSAACTIVGPAWVALVLAGGVISAVHSLPAGPTYTAALSLLGMTVLALLASTRSSPQPHAPLQGLLSTVVFGLGLLLVQLSPNQQLASVWGQDLVGIGLALLLAAAATYLAAWAVLPTLAADEVAALTSQALQHTAQLLSAHLSQLIHEPPAAALSWEPSTAPAAKPPVQQPPPTDPAAQPAAAAAAAAQPPSSSPGADAAAAVVAAAAGLDSSSAATYVQLSSGLVSPTGVTRMASTGSGALGRVVSPFQAVAHGQLSPCSTGSSSNSQAGVGPAAWPAGNGSPTEAAQHPSGVKGATPAEAGPVMLQNTSSRGQCAPSTPHRPHPLGPAGFSSSDGSVQVHAAADPVDLEVIPDDGEEEEGGGSKGTRPSSRRFWAAVLASLPPFPDALPPPEPVRQQPTAAAAAAAFPAITGQQQQQVVGQQPSGQQQGSPPLPRTPLGDPCQGFGQVGPLTVHPTTAQQQPHGMPHVPVAPLESASAADGGSVGGSPSAALVQNPVSTPYLATSPSPAAPLSPTRLRSLDTQGSLVFDAEPDEAAYLALLRHLSATNLQSTAGLRLRRPQPHGPAASAAAAVGSQPPGEAAEGRSTASRWSAWADRWLSSSSSAPLLGLRNRRISMGQGLPTTTTTTPAAAAEHGALGGGLLPSQHQTHRPGSSHWSSVNSSTANHPQQQAASGHAVVVPAGVVQPSSNYSSLLAAAGALLEAAAAEPPPMLTVPPPAAVRPWRYLLQPLAAVGEGEEAAGGVQQQQQEEEQEEVQFLWHRSFKTDAWRKLIFAVQVVMFRVAALETLVEDTSLQAAVHGRTPTPPSTGLGPTTLHPPAAAPAPEGAAPLSSNPTSPANTTSGPATGQHPGSSQQPAASATPLVPPLYRTAMAGVLTLLGAQLVGFLRDVSRLVEAWDSRSNLATASSSSSSSPGCFSRHKRGKDNSSRGGGVQQQASSGGWAKGQQGLADHPAAGGLSTGVKAAPDSFHLHIGEAGGTPSVLVDAAGASGQQEANSNSVFDRSDRSTLSGGSGAEWQPAPASEGSGHGSIAAYAGEWPALPPSPAAPLVSEAPQDHTLQGRQLSQQLSQHQQQHHLPHQASLQQRLQQQQALIDCQGSAPPGVLQQELEDMGAGDGSSSYLMEARLGWEAGRQLLGREAEAALGAYWWRVRGASKVAPVRVSSARQAISVVFLWTLVVGFIEAVEQLEEAVQNLLRAYTTPVPSSTRSSTAPQPLPSSHSQLLQNSLGPHQTNARPSGAGPSARHMVAAATPWCSYWWWCLNCQARSAVAYLWPLLELVLWVPGWKRLWQLLQELPELATAAAWQQLLCSRKFHVALKYWVATAVVLVLTIVLTEEDATVRATAPVFGFVATAVAMQERVEATADKVVLRLIGTVVGASVGHLLIIWSWPLSSAWHMAIALAAAAALVGAFAETRLRPGVGLGLFTMTAVVLCQHESACLQQAAVSATAAAAAAGHAAGAPARAAAAQHALTARCQPADPLTYYITRMASVALGCVWAAVVNRLLLPWFTSDWAAEELAAAVSQAAALTQELYCLNISRMSLINNEEQQPSPAQPRLSLEEQRRAVAAAATTTPTIPSMDTGSTAGPVRSSTRGRCPAVHTCSPQLHASAAELMAWEGRVLLEISQGLSRRVVAVNTSLKRDVVTWRRGPWVTPQVVSEVCRLTLELVEAVESLRLVLAPLPGARQVLPVSGHVYRDWASPMHSHYSQTLAAVQELAAATASHLLRPSATTWQVVSTQISALEQQRLTLRGAVVQLRRAMHARVHDSARAAGAAAATAAAAAPYWNMRPQDSAFFFAFAYGLSRVFNKVTAIARAALQATDMA